MFQVIGMLGAFAAAIIVVLGVPLVKAYSRKIDGEAKNPRSPEEVTYRLERIEQAIEAMAIEIERISEGQRFTTRLLSEPRSDLAPRQSALVGSSPGGGPPVPR